MAGTKIIEIPHPYLAGVICRSDGSIRTPAGNITAGYKDPVGYRIWQMQHPRKNLRVHRLICEAFHGLCPEDKTAVDHINRDRGDNRPENLRWVTCSENSRNTAKADAAARIYGFHPVDNLPEYARMYQKRHAQDNNRGRRSRYLNDPEYREKILERRRARYANDPEYREKRAAYHRARYANNPEVRERQEARNRANNAKKKKTVPTTLKRRMRRRFPPRDR